jgi:hypothetical protein
LNWEQEYNKKNFFYLINSCIIAVRFRCYVFS